MGKKNYKIPFNPGNVAGTSVILMNANATQKAATGEYIQRGAYEEFSSSFNRRNTFESNDVTT